MSNSEILLYQTENGQTKIDVRLEEETVWLSIDQMSQLFQKSRSTINEHIINIFDEGELEKEPSVRKIGISDFSTKPTNYYNLDILNRIVTAYLELAEIQALNQEPMYMNDWIKPYIDKEGYSKPFRYN